MKRRTSFFSVFFVGSVRYNMDIESDEGPSQKILEVRPLAKF